MSGAKEMKPGADHEMSVVVPCYNEEENVSYF